MPTYLLIDSNFLCYRCLMTMGNLSNEDKPTGVIFGFLDQVFKLAEKLNSNKLVFCWDSKISVRRQAYPDYKKKAKIEDEETLKLIEIGFPQFNELRTKILPEIGFRNILFERGFEADDVIARACEQIFQKEDMVIIISPDNDLYQLLSTPIEILNDKFLSTISIYNPITKKLYTWQDFYNEWGIEPSWWVEVKALAGCPSDNVKGMKGIGYKTAIKFLQNSLSVNRMTQIHNEYHSWLDKNIQLVYLPHVDSSPIELVKDEITIEKFEKVCEEYGLYSFLKKERFIKWRNRFCPN